jgi:hypothetical protein
MYPSNLSHVNFCNIGCLMIYFYWNEMCSLCKLFYPYHDGITFPCCRGKFGNAIDSNKFSFPLKNGQWVKQSCWMYMLILYLLTFQASSQIINEVFLHTRPKILASYSCNSFMISWMSIICHIMHLL